MGQRPYPRQEELEFIIGRIIRGHSNEDIRQALMEYGPDGRIKYGEHGVFGERDPRILAKIRRIVEITKGLITKELERKVRLEVDPAIRLRRQEHWNELGRIAQELYRQLSLPDLADITSEVILSGRLLTPLGQPKGWTYHPPRGDRPQTITLSIEKTEPLLFDGLLAHLETEFPQFRVTLFKERAGRLLYSWQILLSQIEQKVTASSRMGISAGAGPGLSPTLASFCLSWLVTNHADREPRMELDRRPAEAGEGLLILHPRGLPASWLARGSSVQLTGLRKAIHGLTGDYIADERLEGLVQDKSKLMSSAQDLKAILDLVFRRRTFQGSCPICTVWSA